MTARVLALLALGAACAAAGANAAAPPPDAKSLALSTGDFVSAKVDLEGSDDYGGATGYIRVFKPGSKLGARPLYSVSSFVSLYPTAAKASADLDKELALYRTKQGRAKLAKQLVGFYAGAVQLENALKKKKHAKPPAVRAVVGAPVGAGPGAVRIPITLRLGGAVVRMETVVLLVDRAVETATLTALLGQKIDLRDVARALAAEREHAAAAFAVVSAAAPASSGTGAAGQTLTAYVGDWSGGPTDFAYAWSRCDASGNACAPIAVATAPTYTATADDVGSTLRVTVTASNSTTSAQATSPAYGVGVTSPATPPPVATQPATTTTGTVTWIK